MFRKTGSRILLVIVLVSLGALVQAAAKPEPMKQDNVHIRTWNQFMVDILALHERRIAGQTVKINSKVGGYANQPDFYTEQEFVDAKGRLLARLQWERKHPENLHAIELFIHDEQGRVIRDYAGAYLPHYRNAPTQTLVSLHQYNGKLHAFRTFDASAEFIFESCSGAYQGKVVNIALDIDEKEALFGKPDSIITSKRYTACFQGLGQTAGIYLQPQ